jgi:hypothetical protein
MSSSKPKYKKKTTQDSKSSTPSQSSDPAPKRLQQQATQITESSKEAKPKSEEPSAKTAEPSGTKAVKREIDDLDTLEDSPGGSRGEGDNLLPTRSKRVGLSTFQTRSVKSKALIYA